MADAIIKHIHYTRFFKHWKSCNLWNKSCMASSLKDDKMNCLGYQHLSTSFKGHLATSPELHLCLCSHGRTREPTYLCFDRQFVDHQRQDFCHLGCGSTFTVQHAWKKSRERRGHLCNVSHLSGTDGGIGGGWKWFLLEMFSIQLRHQKWNWDFWRIHQDLENPKNQFGEVELSFFHDLPFQTPYSTINQMHPKRFMESFELWEVPFIPSPFDHLV